MALKWLDSRGTRKGRGSTIISPAETMIWKRRKVLPQKRQAVTSVVSWEGMQANCVTTIATQELTLVLCINTHVNLFTNQRAGKRGMHEDEASQYTD